jgi:hypothetical protein
MQSPKFTHPIVEEETPFTDAAFWGLTAINGSMVYIAATAAAGAVLGYGLGNRDKGGKVAAYFGLAGAIATGIYVYKTGKKVSAKLDRAEAQLEDAKKKYDKVAADLQAITGGARKSTSDVIDLVEDIASMGKKFVPSS